MANGDLLIKNAGELTYFPLNFEELEQKAKEKLAQGPFQYIHSGAGGEQTARNNRRAFENYSIVPRFLNDVSTLDTSVELFGKQHPTPFLFAPVGVNRMVHEDGELAVVRVAEALQMPYIQSTVSSCSIEEIAAVAPNHSKWFQLYWSENEEVAYSMVARAEKAGYEAIVLTVDTVTLGWREQDIRSQFSPLLEGFASGNYQTDPAFLAALPEQTKEAMIESQLTNIYHPHLTWQHVQELKKRTSLPVLIKGILHEDDAMLALASGVDGIVVSNHGGRQLDGVISSLDALPSIVEVVAGRVPVLFDSGIYRGIDALKALALGATAVLIGRPFVYGLAYSGEEGVKRVMQNLYDEFEISMRLAGARDLHEARSLRVVKSSF